MRYLPAIYLASGVAPLLFLLAGYWFGAARLRARLKESAQRLDEQRALAAEAVGRGERLEADHVLWASEREKLFAELSHAREQQGLAEAQLAELHRAEARVADLEKQRGAAAADRKTLESQLEARAAACKQMQLEMASLQAAKGELEARARSSDQRLASLEAQRAREHAAALAAERGAAQAKQEALGKRLAELERMVAELLPSPDRLLENARLHKELAEKEHELQRLRGEAESAARLARQLELLRGAGRPAAGGAPGGAQPLGAVAAAPTVRAAVLTDLDGLVLAGLGDQSREQGLAAASVPIVDLSRQVEHLLPLGAINRIILVDDRDSAFCAALDRGRTGEGRVLSSVLVRARAPAASPLEQAALQLQWLERGEGLSRKEP